MVTVCVPGHRSFGFCTVCPPGAHEYVKGGSPNEVRFTDPSHAPLHVTFVELLMITEHCAPAMVPAKRNRSKM